jgi:cytoskeletal protein CcmA (bactofilin family)
MPKNNEHKGLEKISTTLGRETSFSGILKFRESLKIDGRFDGEIESPGFLYVENGATVKANIKVGSVVIGGVVRGNIEASERLEMLASGKVFGNIRTAKLNIADGVVFEGKCEMIRNPGELDIFSAPVEQIKKAAQSV